MAWPWGCCLILFLDTLYTLCLRSTAGYSSLPSYQQPGAAVSLPGGSWLETAQDVRLQGNRLCARLRQEAGGPFAPQDCVAVQVGQRFENGGGVFRVEQSTAFPGGNWMITASDARMEGNLLFARLQRMDLTWVEAHAVVSDGAYYWNDDGVFRLLMQACETLTCLHGYVLQFNSTYIYCQFLRCDPVIDRDTCCEPAMPCDNISTCPNETVPDPDGYCPATTCDEDRDRDSCCVPKGYCYDLPQCIVSYTPLPGAENSRCPRPACDAILDRDTCCTPAAPCTSFANHTCPEAPFYFNRSWWCDGIVCEEERDRQVCCMPADNCANSTVQVCTRGFILKADALERYCDGAECDAIRDSAACCNALAPCTDIGCPYGYTTVVSNFCADVVCDTAVDTAHCCSNQALCTNLVGRDCPFGEFFNTTYFCTGETCDEATDRPLCCQTADPCTSFSCPVSYVLRDNATNLFCEGLACDDQRDLDTCCEDAMVCTNLTCPHAFTPRANSSGLYCLGPTCILERDQWVCCEPAAPCDILYTCPHGMVLRPEAYCDGIACEVVRDLDICCEAAMPCTNITCPWNHIHTPDHYCPATTCEYDRDVDHCCELGVAIRFVRFAPTQLRAVTADDSFRPVGQLAEFTPYWHGTRTALETATAYAINGDYLPHEGPDNIIDNNLVTKWLDFESTPVIVEYPVGEKMDTFTVTTAEDVPSRDPIAWRVEASVDGSFYVTIHELLTNGETIVPTTRNTETVHFPIAVPCLPPKPDIENGADPLCAEGTLVPSGGACTAACATGFQPSDAVLNCTAGDLSPRTFSCT